MLNLKKNPFYTSDNNEDFHEKVHFLGYIFVEIP